jgi:hypothetical protein
MELPPTQNRNPIRRQIEENGTMPNIPLRAKRRWKNCFSPVLYRALNAIEHMFCRLKDFRRVATWHDRSPSTSSPPSASPQPSATGYATRHLALVAPFVGDFGQFAGDVPAENESVDVFELVGCSGCASRKLAEPAAA